MELSSGEAWTVLHGMVFGAVFLLAFGGGLAGLYSMKPEWVTVAGRKTMNAKTAIAIALLVVTALLLAGCTPTNGATGQSVGAGTGQGMMSGGTAWGMGAFRTNGERIYFTATSERGTAISYTGGPASSGWMMGNGQLACASCHGPDGRGGVHRMGMNQVMDAKDIRWSVLQGEFDLDKFRLAVVKGQDPGDGRLWTRVSPPASST